VLSKGKGNRVQFLSRQGGPSLCLQRLSDQHSAGRGQHVCTKSGRQAPQSDLRLHPRLALSVRNAREHFPVEHPAHLSRELLGRERLLKKRSLSLEHTAPQNIVVGVARHE